VDSRRDLAVVKILSCEVSTTWGQGQGAGLGASMVGGLMGGVNGAGLALFAEVALGAPGAVLDVTAGVQGIGHFVNSSGC